MNDALAPRDKDYFIPSKWKKAHFTICGVVRVRGVIDAWVFIGHRCEVGDRKGVFVLVKICKYGRRFTFWAHRSDVKIEDREKWVTP